MSLNALLDDTTTQRRIGRSAWVMAWVGLVAGQLHALSRFATADGSSDLDVRVVRAWAEPAADLLAPLLGWADPDVVYLTYGKIWLPVVLAFTLGAMVAYRRRSPAGVERWAWRVSLAGYWCVAVGVFFDYWTQWTSSPNVLFAAGFAITVPGLLVTTLGSTVLGIVLLRRGFRPVLPAVLLTLAFPGLFAISTVTSLGSVLLPTAFAFGVLGHRLLRSPDSRTTPAAPVGSTSH